MYRTDFTVRGSGEFPIDMLRYDQCCPRDTSDVDAIDGPDSGLEARNVALTVYHAQKKHNGLHPRRWERFHWKIVEAHLPRKQS